MPIRKQYAINGSGGAYVSIIPPIPCRQADIREDEAATSQGLTYQVPDDAFVTTYTVGLPQGPNVPQISLGHQTMQGSGFAPMLGYPAQNQGASFQGNYSAGTTYALGQTALYTDNLLYISLAAGNIGNTPATTPAKWAVVPNYVAGTTIIKLRSKSATATSVDIIFYD